MIEPYIRKIILVDQQFLDDLQCTSITDYTEFSTPALDTHVISLPLRSSQEIDTLTQYVDPSEIRSGTILVKPGYTDQFVSLDNFAEDMIFRKFGLFVQLCIALGATKVSISNIEDVSLKRNKSNSIDGEIGLSAPVGEAEASTQVKQSMLSEDSRKSILNLNTEAEGGEPNFEAAQELMARHGLHRDSLFNDLLNMSRVSTNRLRKHQVSLDFSADVKKILDSSIQAKIEMMSKFHQGHANFEKTSMSLQKTKNATKLTVVVDF